MLFSQLSVALLAIGAAHALPPTTRASYAVKERHVVPRAWTSRGPAPADELIHLQIGLKQSSRIENHLMEIANPRHARYGKHLSELEVNDIIRPAQDTVDLVGAWLAEHDIADATYSAAQDWVHVVIPIGKAEELLQTKYETYEHPDGMTLHRAPEWSLPRHLHEHIDVVQPTTSFFSPKRQASTVNDVSAPVSNSWWEGAGKHAYGPGASKAFGGDIAKVCNETFTTPECIRTLYGTINYTPQAPEKGSIALCNYLNETNKRSDIYQFLTQFRPEAANEANEFPIVIINNAVNDQGPYTAAELAAHTNIEANLDAENIISVAYPIPLTAYSTGGNPPFIPDLGSPTNTNEPYMLFLNYILGQSDLPLVLSTSYGDDEQTVPLSYADRVCSGFAQLGARGVSVLFSSGDSGVGANGTCFSNTDPTEAKFLPAFPAACPWVTTVGATKAFQPEEAVTRFGSGAGFSNYFGQPSYQSEAVDNYVADLNGLYDGLYNKSGRAYPDVAAQGNHDAIVWDGIVRTVGGTSASSPTFAAVVALVNDALLAAGRPALGFLNPWLYGGAYRALNDITIGSSIGCNTSGFPAAPGWDAVTGFGTPNFGKMVFAAFLENWGEGGPFGGHGGSGGPWGGQGGNPWGNQGGQGGQGGSGWGQHGGW